MLNSDIILNISSHFIKSLRMILDFVRFMDNLFIFFFFLLQGNGYLLMIILDNRILKIQNL